MNPESWTQLSGFTSKRVLFCIFSYMRLCLLTVLLCFLLSIAAQEEPVVYVRVDGIPVENPTDSLASVPTNVEQPPKKAKWLIVSAIVSASWTGISLMQLKDFDDKTESIYRESHRKGIDEEYYQNRKNRIKDKQNWRDFWLGSSIVGSALLVLSYGSYIVINF